MPHDYEDLHNADQLDDDELRRLVREQLAENSSLDVTQISVNASGGSVILSGRVGTDEERQIAEHVLTDVLGLDRFRNDLVVDFNYRAEAPEASDDLSADRESADDAPELDIEVPLSGESPFLADTVIDAPGDASDAESAVENGMTWSPPDGPTPEGLPDTA
jgi:hypothetical protein